MKLQSKVRMTRQRRVILETLAMDKTHPSVEDVYSQVRRTMPRVSLGTVYRNLEKLAGEGLIRRIDTVGNRMRFDGNADEHHHIRCTNCGRIDDVHDLAGMTTPGIASEIAGYKVIGVSVYLSGICTGCREAGGETASAGRRS